MKRRGFLHVFLAFWSSVRVRLMLSYLVVMAIIMVIFGGSLYASQVLFNPATAESNLEMQIYQEAQQLSAGYRQMLSLHQSPATLDKKLNSDEIVLLLDSSNAILDKHGTLPAVSIQQLQDKVRQGQAISDLTIPQSQGQDQHWGNWGYNVNNNYRVVITPVLDQNKRIATLVVGLPRKAVMPLFVIWLFHGILGLLAAAIGGYWLAGRALRPVKMITRMANEINATDLRRRLNLNLRDEFGELAATFDQMLGRLDAAFRRQTQFTADASHELRTPLTIIDLELNRALTQPHNCEEHRQILELVQSENVHMTNIVNSLLLLARADTGQLTLQRQQVDLSDLALECVERLLPLAREHDIILATGDLPELLVNGDPHYLTRMMLNLIENAIKYTHGSGQRVHVELTAASDKWGMLRVQDDGPGISDEHLPYLFDRFYRVDRARSHNPSTSSGAQKEVGGTGLGLSIVQWIVQAHGGDVHVESQPGKGTLFEVRLPLLHIPASQEALATSTHKFS
ncbi:sensor histidine kinase [Dictyobacter aurantiacus]|uniref:histidine kinase n=1 Tax=Dictyobacter aurantiacus TaxID=1936993 RepID=A0A401ZNM3_9CHLR|nr:ATP-binding protein [Dictyobacter aurantiacus]GCE08508.1 two-component sensor histidine kinase [Dictyobacter aurantiacus]